MNGDRCRPPWFHCHIHCQLHEDFTLPHIFHVDSMWTPGQLLESMWSLDIFSLVVAQPKFCLESIWSPTGVHLDSSFSIWTTWSPHQNTGNMKSPSRTPYGVHMDSMHLTVLYPLLYKIKKVHDQELNP